MADQPSPTRGTPGKGVCFYGLSLPISRPAPLLAPGHTHIFSIIFLPAPSSGEADSNPPT
ncbi:hypothetical protein P7K49_024641, partial [Saguinus oedipus]